MNKSFVIIIVIMLVIATVTISLFSQQSGNLMYRKALSKTLYKVLVRESYINPNQLTKAKFDKEIMNQVIQPNQPITSDKEIERQSDLVLKSLVEKKYHTQPIVKEYIMNLIKIEYHVMYGDKKVGRALQSAQ